jgi:T3SS negative regulator,GrlR
MEGFWTAHFNTPVGAGAGVAYFREGNVFGGDGGYTYLGDYQYNESSLSANIRVSPFVVGTPSVFGSIGRAFSLRIAAKLTGDEVIGTGTSDIFPGISFGVKLKRVK